MIAKALEIRDRMTFIPVLAVSMEPTQVVHYDSEGWNELPKAEVDEARHRFICQDYLLRRAGYSGQPPLLILLTRLDGGEAHYDPYQWANRTWVFAHKHIMQNWESLSDGDVIDVEFILGETTKPKISERLEQGT